MIRMNPAHDTVNPPGCVQPAQQENVQHQEKPLTKELEAYLKGFQDGFASKEKWKAISKRSSEFDR